MYPKGEKVDISGVNGTKILKLLPSFLLSFVPVLSSLHLSPSPHQAHEGSETSNMDVVVIKIVHVFVDALPHVPEHRRLPILSQLVTTLGPARFLWVLMLLLFKQHATKTAGSAADKARHESWAF